MKDGITRRSWMAMVAVATAALALRRLPAAAAIAKPRADRDAANDPAPAPLWIGHC